MKDEGKARHWEFGLGGKAASVMSFENPAVAYALIESKGLNLIGCSQNRPSSKSRFYEMLSDIVYWERVQEIPPECDTWYHVKISILGKTCVIDTEIGQRSSMPGCGFLKVINIDDTDEE